MNTEFKNKSNIDFSIQGNLIQIEQYFDNDEYAAIEINKAQLEIIAGEAGITEFRQELPLREQIKYKMQELFEALNQHLLTIRTDTLIGLGPLGEAINIHNKLSLICNQIGLDAPELWAQKREFMAVDYPF